MDWVKTAIFRFPLGTSHRFYFNQSLKNTKIFPDFDQRIIKMRQFACFKMDMVEKLVYRKSETDISSKILPVRLNAC